MTAFSGGPQPDGSWILVDDHAVDYSRPRERQKLYSEDQARDDHGRFGSGDGLTDRQRLTAEGAKERGTAFDKTNGAAVGVEARTLAADWYSMHPTSHADDWVLKTLQPGLEKTTWDAVYKDTQARLASDLPPGDVSVYRGIPGKAVLDAVEAAKAKGAEYVVVPLKDELGSPKTHAVFASSGEHDLAANYAARRWARHGGDPNESGGVVLHLTVPKSEVMFSTAHSGFTNPAAPEWNEYTVMTGKNQFIRLPMKDVEVVGRLAPKSAAARPSSIKHDDAIFPSIPFRITAEEAIPPRSQKLYSESEARDEHGKWTDGSGSESRGVAWVNGPQEFQARMLEPEHIDLPTQITDFEKQRIDDMTESALAVNPKTGEVVVSKSSTTKNPLEVTFEPSEIRKMKDCVAIHNHPGVPGETYFQGKDMHPVAMSDRKGLGFSPADVNFAIRADLAQTRVITRGENGEQIVYSMTRPRGGWLQSRDVIFDAAVEDSAMKLHDDFLKTGVSEAMARDKSWTAVSKQYGLNYKRTVTK